MTGPLYRLTKACVRYRWTVLGVWLVLVAGVALLALRAGTDTSDNLTLPGADSQAATDLLDARFPGGTTGATPSALAEQSVSPVGGWSDRRTSGRGQ